jgi:hypothetical protein
MLTCYLECCAKFYGKSERENKRTKSEIGNPSPLGDTELWHVYVFFHTFTGFYVGILKKKYIPKK